jgi:hypothetical protein
VATASYGRAAGHCSGVEPWRTPVHSARPLLLSDETGPIDSPLTGVGLGTALRSICESLDVPD